jgi:hypothetical protein
MKSEFIIKILDVKTNCCISDCIYSLLDDFHICGISEDGHEALMAGAVHYCLHMHIGL